MKRLILVRHGETEWSRSGRHTGRTDVPLTTAGEDQALAVGAELSKLDVHPVRSLTSPLQRAVVTADLAGFPEAELDRRLVEVDYGDYEGRTSAEIREERPGWDLFRDGCPAGESIAAAGARADAVLADLAPDDGDGDVLLFGHGHFTRVLAARYLGLPAEHARLLALGTATISILGHEHWWRAIRLWNHEP